MLPNLPSSTTGLNLPLPAITPIAPLLSTSLDTSIKSSNVSVLPDPTLPLTGAREIAFVDRRMAGAVSLAQGLRSNIKVVLLDLDTDGIQQITAVLKTEKDLRGIHILSNGAAGRTQLGSTQLSTDTLATYAPLLQQWTSALRPGADLLLYGSNVSATIEGKALVQQLGDLVKVDVAASTDATGNPNVLLGSQANWVFETKIGLITIPTALTALTQSNYIGTLSSTLPTILPSPAITPIGPKVIRLEQSIGKSPKTPPKSVLESDDSVTQV